jgi:hypothetical protein
MLAQVHTLAQVHILAQVHSLAQLHSLAQVHSLAQLHTQAQVRTLDYAWPGWVDPLDGRFAVQLGTPLHLLVSL